MSIHAPYRYDIVGSFLRPEYLRHARAEFEAAASWADASHRCQEENRKAEAGRLSHEALKEVEDRAITDLVNKEKGAS
jgi:5-methyltetrahydropteroyltriglutamate--homocysteine methyltransferase